MIIVIVINSLADIIITCKSCNNCVIIAGANFEPLRLMKTKPNTLYLVEWVESICKLIWSRNVW